VQKGHIILSQICQLLILPQFFAPEKISIGFYNSSKIATSIECLLDSGTDMIEEVFANGKIDNQTGVSTWLVR
jgi:hypothetical protein